MPFNDCNENICVDVLSDVLQNQASVNCEVARPVSSDLKVKGINCGHLNIQGICGQNMSKFSELKLMLTAEENRNLHIFGLSETKLKSYPGYCREIRGLKVRLNDGRECDGCGK